MASAVPTAGTSSGSGFSTTTAVATGTASVFERAPGWFARADCESLGLEQPVMTIRATTVHTIYRSNHQTATLDSV